ncbi:MAG: glycerol-3-phosphate acyltransferase [Pseudomonadota bacterium]|nr:glycerol-3-phosphate acyltransferase [Pseudomonadota bacterium]
MFTLLLETLIAFFIGSVPFGILVCQSFGLQNPRSYGSTNIGASNVARQSYFAGVVTLVLDILKGYLALKLLSTHDAILLAVVAGHCFSPLLAFNGGKGVATCLGALLASQPGVAAVLIFTWASVFVNRRVPATSSITSAILLLIYAASSAKTWVGITSIIILVRHIPNVIASRQPKTTQA